MQWSLVAAFTALLVIWLIRKWKQRVAYFHSLQNMGIPTAPVSVMFGGNLFLLFKLRGIQMHRLLLKEYGSISGHYFGRLRTVVVANYSTIREICIRRASDFPNRSTYFRDVVAEPEEFLSKSLINIKDANWKNHRAIISRSFTDSKLELLRPVMVDRVFEMIRVIHQRENSIDAVSNVFKRLTLDVIGSCAFGVATNCQTNDQSQLLKASEQLFNSHNSIRTYLPSFIFENLRWPVRQFMFFQIWLKTKFTNYIDNNMYMVDVCRAILGRRLEQVNQETNRVDLLHSMIEHKSPGVGKCPAQSKAPDSNNDCPFASSKKFTEGDIVSNMVLFYEAGYETSSTALTFLTHLLIAFPLQQRRLRAEILRVLFKEHLLKTTKGNDLSSDPTDEELLNTSFSYNPKTLQQKLSLSLLRKLHWMDCFVKESMRMYPPVWNFISRTAAKDNIELKFPGNDKPIMLPSDVRISVPIVHIHYDPNYWNKPFNFRPQRFSAIINDNDLTKAEQEEQQTELDSFKIKDCPSLRFSENQPRDVGLEELSSKGQDVNDNIKSPLTQDWDNDSDDSEHKNQSKQMLLKRLDPAHYLPFGVGPRNCIGMRFALLEIKLTLLNLLLNFEMEPIAKELNPSVEIEFKSVTIAPKDDIQVHFRPIELIKSEK